MDREGKPLYLRGSRSAIAKDLGREEGHHRCGCRNGNQCEVIIKGRCRFHHSPCGDTRRRYCWCCWCNGGYGLCH